MSTDQPDLQFDRAEFDAPPEALSCAACSMGVADEYWTVGGKVVCAPCLVQVRAAFKDNFGLALALGLAAAAAGAVAWFAITALTGYMLGIVAVGVGWLVGHAVRRGAKGMGGPKYQALAVALTYAAIVSFEAPFTPGFELLGQMDAAQLGSFATRVLSSPFTDVSVMGLVILAFALWEAFRLNASAAAAFAGPFKVSANGG